MNPGAAPASAVPGPITRRTAWLAAGSALVTLGAWAVLIRAELAPGIPTVQVLVGALYFGWPYLVAAPIAVVAASRAAVGIDAPARLLAFATSGRRGGRDEWGAAMRAELASITASARERLRFAAGCAPTALRRGWGRSPWIVAACSAALFATLTLVTSRASLGAGSRAGSLWGVLYGPPQITLLLVGLVAAWTGRSLRTGLEHAVLALAGILVGVLAVAVPEGARWAREAGVSMLDGDAPGTPLTAAGGALDALESTLIWGLPQWLPWTLLGAAAGARLRRRTRPATPRR